jgi:hypothetical protein
MTFPVHRSEERTPGERGEAFGRAQAGPIANTLAIYRRMFAETHAIDAREAGAEVRLPDAAREEIAGIARGARQSAPAACWRRTGTGTRTSRSPR